MLDERKRLAERLKQYHDWNNTPGAYDSSIFGMAAKLLEADAVEVVRCKDCKHLMFSDCYGECKKGYLGIVKPDDFCSYGERKDNA